MTLLTCENRGCPNQFPPKTHRGLAKRFCSTACRLAAWRRVPDDQRQNRVYTKWPPVLVRAKAIVEQYVLDNGGLLPTVRKLFYKLIGIGAIPNDRSAYASLCRLTAEGRREGTFPDLADDTREIARPLSFDSPADARAWLKTVYRRDRAATQPYNLYIVCEKDGTKALLKQWFHGRGLAVVCLGGCAPTQLIKSLRAEIAADSRRTVMLVMTDYDASGLAIFERFKDAVTVGMSDKTHFVHVGLTKAQVRAHQLPKAPGKDKVAASERKAFLKKNGEDVQVELDALDEPVLKAIYEAALAPWWNEPAYQATLRREARERAAL